MDDLDDGPTMGDFTLDHFLTQLLRYLEANKDELEAMPPGVYAVSELSAEAQPGVVFCLRQRNSGNTGSRQRLASPVHPFYLIYIQENGNIRYGCPNARQTLAVFEAAAAGKAAPIVELCDRFDHETAQGRDMAHYDKLLNDGISHVRQAHDNTQIRHLQACAARDFMLPTASETPGRASDFELVTWLVIEG